MKSEFKRIGAMGVENSPDFVPLRNWVNTTFGLISLLICQIVSLCHIN